VPHGAVKAIHRESEWYPSVDKGNNVAWSIGIKIDFGVKHPILDLRVHLNAESVGCLQCVNDMEIMCKSFSEILPKDAW
jgi:hypothetical protein